MSKIGIKRMEIVQRFFAWALVISWMGVIFYLSHQPAGVSSELSSGITQLFLRFIEFFIPFMQLDQQMWHFFIRKSAHFCAYFILGILLMNALRKNRFAHRQIMLAVIISLLYAVSDEVHQLFIPGRSGEVRDILIDTIGATAGIFVYRLIVNMMIKRHFKEETNL